MFHLTVHLSPYLSDPDIAMLQMRLLEVSEVTSVELHLRDSSLDIHLQSGYAGILAVKRLTAEANDPSITRNHSAALASAGEPGGAASEASIG